MSAIAQNDAGSLRVLVLDQSGAVVPGATVTATNVGTSTSREAVSDGEGYATFTPVTRGRYDVRVMLSGFRTVDFTGVDVDVNEREFVRITLDSAAAAETVQVTAQRANLQTEEGSIGQVVTGEVAVQLPLAARRYSELALLIPGTSPSTMTVETRGPGWFVSNGNYHTQNNFMLDGFDNNQGTQNAQSLSAQVVQPNPDSIEQFKVQTNSYSAEFGRSAGAVVNVSIKSGTNQIRGSGWYFNRDASLAAKSWNANTFGLRKDDLAWHQGGATFGGPIAKNKVFYFGSYEGFRQDFTTTGILTVPTLAQRGGVFATDVRNPFTGQLYPNRTIPRADWNSLGAKILDLFPQPNRDGRVVAGGRVVENYAWQRPGQENTHKFDIRSDLVASGDSRVFARYSFLQQDIFREALFPTLGEGTSNQGEQYNRNQSLGLSWTRIFGARMVNEARFGYNRTHSRFAHAAANDMTADQFGFVGLPAEYLTTGGIPLMDFNNYQDLGIRNFRPQFQNPITWQALDTLSLLLGNHSLRTGFEVRLKRNELLDVSRRSPAYRFTGEYTGDDIADLLIGTPFSLNATTVPVLDWRQEVYAGFVQDDWKVTPNLTVNAGLRYEYGTPYYGAGENQNINFNLQTGQLVYPTGDDQYLMDTDRNNVAPRLGVAWQAMPDRLVVRGGYGVFYSIEDMRGSEGIIALNPPTLVDATLQRVNNTAPPPLLVSDPFPAGLTSNYDSRTVGVKARQIEQQAATIQQWNVAAEFLLPWQSTFEVAYVGNRAANLLGNVPVNGVPFGVNGAVAANRPFPNWRQIDVNITEGQSTYDALQLKYEKRYTGGLYILGSYTFADSEDEIGAWGAGGSGTQLILAPDYSNLDQVLRGERGPNAQIARHRFTFTQVWQLPIGRGRAWGTDMSPVLDALIGGWQVSSITSVRSGLPVNVTLSRNGTDPNTGLAYSFFDRNGGYFRPNIVGDPNAASDASANRGAYLSNGAYAVPALNTPGNAPRNSAWGPGNWTTDLSLVKRFTLPRFSFDVRAEAFNVFNHTNYADPNGTFGTAQFGSITSAGLPRIVQLAVRVGF
ncbi:carboxypeptidase regulatory-like domain-containing protein [Luteitalea sp.]|uniref:TonB-dependent receptor n=1 Tax=Luteitalea sp. TaxID=2004800 RepID=UPI0037CC1249